MVATYNTGLVSAIDRVRFELQDTDMTAAMLHDEEIQYVLFQYDLSVSKAAVHLAEVLSRKFAMQATTIATPDLRVEMEARARLYAQLARELRQRTETSLPLPFAGGISQTDKQQRVDNADRTPNTFWRGRHDDPETSAAEG